MAMAGKQLHIHRTLHPFPTISGEPPLAWSLQVVPARSPGTGMALAHLPTTLGTWGHKGSPSQVSASCSAITLGQGSRKE